MSLRARLMVFFPVLHGGLVLASLAQWVAGGPLWWVAVAGVALYLLPPAACRVHGWLWPVREGRSRLDTPDYSPWWGTLQIQGLFNAMPFLEALLRLVPGCYSAWLRLWGSRVGKAVVWTPRIEVADRGFLEIGDRAVVGHRVAFYPHVVDRRRDGSTVLYLKRVRVGAGAFIGAGSRLGPGATVAPETRLPVLTDIHTNGRVERP